MAQSCAIRYDGHGPPVAAQHWLRATVLPEGTGQTELEAPASGLAPVICRLLDYSSRHNRRVVQRPGNHPGQRGGGTFRKMGKGNSA